MSEYNNKLDIVRENRKYEEISQMYNADANISAGKWYFNPTAYADTTKLCVNISSSIDEQISSAQNARNSIIGKMKSPEGQDIEGSIGSCFDEIIVSAQGFKAGISYILVWILKRYSQGLQAGNISTNVVNSLQDELGVRIEPNYCNFTIKWRKY